MYHHLIDRLKLLNVVIFPLMQSKLNLDNKIERKVVGCFGMLVNLCGMNICQHQVQVPTLKV
jgi:hypothetical protein